MKFRNEEFQRKLVLGKLKPFRVALYPLTQFDGPATCDIVRDFDVLDFLVFHGR